MNIFHHTLSFYVTSPRAYSPSLDDWITWFLEYHTMDQSKTQYSRVVTTVSIETGAFRIQDQCQLSKRPLNQIWMQLVCVAGKVVSWSRISTETSASLSEVFGGSS
jgi:hypothetical protein